MNRFRDERFCFYMRHRKIIRQWAALEDEIRKEAHRFLESLEGDFRTLALERVTRARPYIDLDHDFPRLFLVRSNWWRTEATNRLRLAVGLSWKKKSVDLDTRLPWVGVWVYVKLDGGKELRDSIASRCKDLAGGQGYKSTDWWPYYKELRPPNPEFWEDLAPYRLTLLDAVARTWDLFADCVDQVVVTADQ